MELKSTEVGRTDQFPVGMRVLAVDDNPTCLKTLEELLLHCKYHVTRTTESKKALEMLREKSNMFDLVITEVEMPETDGFKLLEIGLAMDLPVILLSAHSDYDSVNKGMIHGACDYLVKPVGLKELQNIWRHVVKKNISSYAKNIGPSEYHLVPSVGKKQNEDDSDRKEEDGDGDKHNGMKSCIRMKRVVWKPELHQKFLDAIQQLGGVDKALPKQIHALMNVEGLTRFNVASHLQKYRLSLKRATYKLNMAQVDGLGNFDATRQLPSLALVSRSHLPQTPSINLQGMNSSRFIQEGHYQKNSTYHHTPLPRVENVNLCQPTSSPLKPLLFPKSNFSAYKEDIKNIKNPAIVGSSLDSSMSSDSFQTACKLPNIPTVTKSDPSTGSCIIQIMTEPCYGKAARRHRSRASNALVEETTELSILLVVFGSMDWRGVSKA